MKEKNIYFISGGGTGGHIYPAFTIVEKLFQDPNTDKVYFIGNPKNLEYEISKNYPQVEFLPVNVSGMPRKLNISFFKWSIELFKAYLQAISYIKKYKPDAIFTTGGYVCAPIILAANTLKTPYMIHDCDSIPGLVSKMAAPNAKIVSIAFENSKKILKSNNIKFNGNPVREVFFNVTKDQARQKLGIKANQKVIFAMGGSQGAKTINNSMCKILKTLSQNNDYYIIIQTGKKNIDEVKNTLEQIFPQYKEKENILIKPYFDEMVYPLKSCDIVISRAGSVSLTEIIQCNAVSILIPYPYAAQDHQRKNATEMKEKGISLYLEDSDCNEENLLNNINQLLLNENIFNLMQEKTKEFSGKNPAQEIVNQLKSIIK